MRRIMEEKATTWKDCWFKSTKQFMEDINLNYCDLKTMEKKKSKNKITGWDSKRWQHKVSEKSSCLINI